MTSDIIPEAVVKVSPNAARPVDFMPLTVSINEHEWVINIPIEEYREAMGLMPTPPHWKRW
tara:strand:- start:577 stop:759 length:183 start_codon:yes stop_codon:yes gene_type:complete